MELRPQVTRYTLQFRLRLRDADVGAQSSDYANEAEVARTFLDRKWERDPRLDIAGNVGLGWEDQLEVTRHDSDNCERRAGSANRFTDNVGICPVTTPPQAVAENDHRRSATLLIWKEGPAQRRPGAEH